MLLIPTCEIDSVAGANLRDVPIDAIGLLGGHFLLAGKTHDYHHDAVLRHRPTRRYRDVPPRQHQDSGLIALVQYDDYCNPNQGGPAPQPRYMTIPSSHAGDTRAILRQGGGFTNLNNEPDNLNSYNLATMRLAANALNDSPVHDLMQGVAVHSLLAGSAVQQRWPPCQRRHDPGARNRH